MLLTKRFIPPFGPQCFRSGARFNLLEKSINPYLYEGSSGPRIRSAILQHSEFIAAYATEIPLPCTYSLHLSSQPYRKKSMLTKHRPITVQTAYGSSSTLYKTKILIQRAIFRAQIWGNFHESSRKAKSNFRIIHSPMFLIKNMSYFIFGKNNTAARPFFPLGHLLGNISAKTE